MTTVDPLLSLPWGNVGAGALVTLAVVSLIRGWLVPRQTLDRLTQSYEDRLKEKDETIRELRDANRAQDARNDELARHVGQLLEVGKTSNAALVALPRGRE